MLCGTSFSMLWPAVFGMGKSLRMACSMLRVTSRLLKKGSECFEGLSMNGKSSLISKPLRSS